MIFTLGLNPALRLDHGLLFNQSLDFGAFIAEILEHLNRIGADATCGFARARGGRRKPDGRANGHDGAEVGMLHRFEQADLE